MDDCLVREQIYRVGVTLAALLLGRLVVARYYAIRLSEVRPTGRQRSIARQVVVLTLVALVSGAFGYRFIPDNDSDSAVDNPVIIWPQPALFDKASAANLKIVDWYEIHDDYRGPPLSDGPGIAHFEQDGIPPEEVVRVLLIMTFMDGPDTQARPRARVDLDLPQGVQLVNCRAMAGNAPCIREAQSMAVSPTERMNHLTITAQTEGVGNMVGFVADFKGANGLAFVSSRTHVNVRLPWVAPGYIGVGQDSSTEPIHVAAHLGIVDADRVNWASGGPHQSDATSAEWDYSADPKLAPPQPAATGVKAALIERDSSNIFWAGILLAIAGSALVAVLQILATEGSLDPRPIYRWVREAWRER